MRLQTEEVYETGDKPALLSLKIGRHNRCESWFLRHAAQIRPWKTVSHDKGFCRSSSSAFTRLHLPNFNDDTLTLLLHRLFQELHLRRPRIHRANQCPTSTTRSLTLIFRLRSPRSTKPPLSPRRSHTPNPKHDRQNNRKRAIRIQRLLVRSADLRQSPRFPARLSRLRDRGAER